MKNLYKKRMVSVVGALSVLLMGIAGPATAQNIEAGVKSGEIPSETLLLGTKEVAVNRLGGSDRYTTAVEVSKAGFPGTAPIVYLANGGIFPDALTAAPAAVKEGGPLLLTTGGQIPVSVQNEIKRLKPSEIVIVGGSNTVSTAVETTAKSLAGKVTRISGTNRYETSRKIAFRAFSSPLQRAYLSTGAGYVDALSAGAAAATDMAPLLLIDPNAIGMDQPTNVLLTGLAPAEIYIVGGTHTVSDQVFKDAETITPRTFRFYGDDRYETSISLVINNLDSATTLVVASGYGFADALVGSALAGKDGNPLVIAPGSCTPIFQGFLADVRDSGVKNLTIIGGFSSVNPEFFEEGTCPAAS